MRTRYTYFVAYRSMGANGNRGTGRFRAYTFKPLNSFERIEELEALREKEYGGKTAITNFQLIRVERPWLKYLLGLTIIAALLWRLYAG